MFKPPSLKSLIRATHLIVSTLFPHIYLNDKVSIFFISCSSRVIKFSKYQSLLRPKVLITVTLSIMLNLNPFHKFSVFSIFFLHLSKFILSILSLLKVIPRIFYSLAKLIFLKLLYELFIAILSSFILAPDTLPQLLNSLKK
jgi:hypothetical protein